MSVRAAEMARILMEDWQSNEESLESFVHRRFSDDQFADLLLALEIIGELKKVDGISEDWLKKPDGTT
jgi:hypothetical protein